MLFHNLFWLVYYDQYESSRFIHNEFPYDYEGIFDEADWLLGSQSDCIPLTISSLGTIVSSRIIKPDGEVTFRAGTGIELLPYFKVELGGRFSAHIDPHKDLVYSEPTTKSGSIWPSYDDNGENTKINRDIKLMETNEDIVNN